MSGTVVVNGVKVRTAKERLLVHAMAEFDNLSNTWSTTQKRTFAYPQTFLGISYQQGSGAASTGKILYFVINALSDADAKFKLATPGLRRVLNLGDVQEFFNSGGITRVDFATDIAETGSSKTVISVGF